MREWLHDEEDEAGMKEGLCRKEEEEEENMREGILLLYCRDHCIEGVLLSRAGGGCGAIVRIRSQ